MRTHIASRVTGSKEVETLIRPEKPFTLTVIDKQQLIEEPCFIIMADTDDGFYEHGPVEGTTRRIILCYSPLGVNISADKANYFTGTVKIIDAENGWWARDLRLSLYRNERDHSRSPSWAHNTIAYSYESFFGTAIVVPAREVTNVDELRGLMSTASNEVWNSRNLKEMARECLAMEEANGPIAKYLEDSGFFF